MVGIIQKRIAVVRHVQTVAKQFAERKLASQVNPVLHLIFQPHTERNVRTGKSLPAARRNRHTQSHKNIGSETPCVRIRKFITVRKEVELHLSAQFDQAPAERTLRMIRKTFCCPSVVPETCPHIRLVFTAHLKLGL